MKTLSKRQLKSVEDTLNLITEGTIFDGDELITDVLIHRFTTHRRQGDDLIEEVRYFPPSFKGQVVNSYDRQSSEFKYYDKQLRMADKWK